MKEIVPEEEGIIKYTEVGEVARTRSNLFVVALILLVGFLGFGLGRLSKIEEARVPITIEYPEGQLAQENASIAAPDTPNEPGANTEAKATPGPIVASKNGTKYYFDWCAGAGRISPKNKVYFATAAAAEARGLSKAANCPGL